MPKLVHVLKHKMTKLKKLGFKIPPELTEEYRIACRLYRREKKQVNILKPVLEVLDMRRIIDKIRRNKQPVPRLMKIRYDELRHAYEKEQDEKRRVKESDIPNQNDGRFDVAANHSG